MNVIFEVFKKYDTRSVDSAIFHTKLCSSFSYLGTVCETLHQN